MTRTKTEATTEVDKKDPSSPDVPLKTFEEIDKEYLKIGDELFLVIDEITSSDYSEEENKLSTHQVGNPSNSETCMKEREALSFIVRTETFTKDDRKIPYINVNDQNVATKKLNSESENYFSECRGDKSLENNCNFPKLLHLKKGSKAVKKTAYDSCEKTSAKNSIEAVHTWPVQNVPEFLKEYKVNSDENSWKEPEPGSFSSPYPDFDESSFEYSFLSSPNDGGRLNIEHYEFLINEAGSLQNKISSNSRCGSSDINSSDNFIANQEHLVQLLIKEFKDDSVSESDQKSSINNTNMEKRNLLKLLKTNGKFKRNINNNLKPLSSKKLIVKLKGRKVLKNDDCTNRKNTRNEIRKPLDKAVDSNSQTSLELIKKYKLKELKIIVEKFDINFNFSQNESTADASVISEMECKKSISQNDSVEMSRPLSDVNISQKSVENTIPLFKEDGDCMIRSNENNNKSSKPNSSNAQEICNISVATKIVDDIVSGPKVNIGRKTDSPRIVVRNMRNFSDVKRIMIENDVKTVNIPENVYNLLKQDNNWTAENSDLKIICNMHHATRNRHLPKKKRKKSSETDERLEKAVSGNLPHGTTGRSQKFAVSAVHNKKLKVGLNNIPKNMTDMSNVEKGSSPKQSNLRYETKKGISSDVSGPMTQNTSKKSTLHNKKFKSSHTCVTKERSHKKLHIHSENKNEFSESRAPNLLSQVTLNSDKNKRIKNKLSHSVINSSRKQIVSYTKCLKKIKDISPNVNIGNTLKQTTLQVDNDKKIKVKDLVRISTKDSSKQLPLNNTKNAIKIKHSSSNASSKTSAKKLFSLKKNGMIKEFLSKYPTENSEKQTPSLKKNDDILKNDLFNPLVDTSAKKLSSHSINGKTPRENFFTAPVGSSEKQVSVLSKNEKKSKNNFSSTKKGAHLNRQFLQIKTAKKNKGNDKKAERLIVSSSLWGAPISCKRNHKSQSSNPCKRAKMGIKKVRENIVTQGKEFVSKNKPIKEVMLVHELPDKVSVDGKCKTFGVKGYVDMNHTSSNNVNNCTVIINSMKKTISHEVIDEKVSHHLMEGTSDNLTLKSSKEHDKRYCRSEKTVLGQICNANFSHIVKNEKPSHISSNLNKNLDSTKTPVDQKNIVEPLLAAGPTKSIEVENR